MQFDLILLDQNLGTGLTGIQFLEKIRSLGYQVPVIMITRDESIESVVKAMKAGAYDYVGKKPDLSELKIIINRALDNFKLQSEKQLLKSEIQDIKGKFIGVSPAIQAVREKIKKILPMSSTVLITGESGTGKEVIAREIHNTSPRKDKPFVVVNCAAIPRDLFESELFGHTMGAFTGAYRARKGKFEQANSGTIFLDEIGELDITLQAKFLRTIEDTCFEPVGGTEQIDVDVRIITATNKNLPEAIEQGKFREDLYYRLNVIQLELPPLQKRREDIPLLIDEFIRKKNREMKKKVRGVSEKALDFLIACDWPGNVRELQNTIERAIIYTDNDYINLDVIEDQFQHLPEDLADYETARQKALHKFQKQYISTILKLCGGNITKAAQRMGISRQGLQKMIKKL